MPLHRIRASTLEGAKEAVSNLDAEGIHLEAGRVMLNRRVESAAALIAVRGAIRVGVADDDELLQPGDGVLLPAGTVYSVQADDEAVAIVFALRGSDV